MLSTVAAAIGSRILVTALTLPQPQQWIRVGGVLGATAAVALPLGFSSGFLEVSPVRQSRTVLQGAAVAFLVPGVSEEVSTNLKFKALVSAGEIVLEAAHSKHTVGGRGGGVQQSACSISCHLKTCALHTSSKSALSGAVLHEVAGQRSALRRKLGLMAFHMADLHSRAAAAFLSHAQNLLLKWNFPFGQECLLMSTILKIACLCGHSRFAAATHTTQYMQSKTQWYSCAPDATDQ